jgi:flavin reductase (DIM6/NTAB) family NADH-FMN oxidoreductase RutF
MHHFDMEQLDGAMSYKLLSSTIVPRPIAWVVTADTHGKANAAPFSLFNFFGGHPPVVCIGMGQRDGAEKDSLANIETTGELVINLVSESLAEAMNTTAIPFPRTVDELQEAGLTTAASLHVRAPRIAASPVALECVLRQIISLDATASLVMAEVRAMHISAEAVTNVQRGYTDAAQLHLIGRMQSPGWYVRTDDRFLLKQMSVSEWQARQARDISTFASSSAPSASPPAIDN